MQVFNREWQELTNILCKVNGRYFFQQSINDDIKINQNIQKFSIGQRDNFTRSGICEIIQTLKKTTS